MELERKRQQLQDAALMPLPDTGADGPLDWAHLVDAAKAFEGERSNVGCHQKRALLVRFRSSSRSNRASSDGPFFILFSLFRAAAGLPCSPRGERCGGERCG